MLKKLPIRYVYCILIGIALGLILGAKSYLSFMYWGETEKFNWVKYFSPHFINYSLWGFLVPFVYYFLHKYPLFGSRNIKIKIKAILAALALSGFHEAFSYVVWFFPIDWLGYFEFNLEEFDYVVGAFPSGFISRFVEYWIIYGLFSAIDFSKKINIQKVELARKESQLSGAQLRALKLQLNPHFLFNTLNTISSLIDINGKDAQKMVFRLGNLLRSVLDADNTQTIALRDELSYVKNYLEIEQVRFHDRLSIELDMDEKTMDCQVPNLILQPLIENAIKHGFSNQTGKGKIVVSSKLLAENKMELIVSDDGSGTDVAIENLLQKGIGLKNVVERLKLIYKNESTLHISSTKNKGFSIRLILPVN